MLGEKTANGRLPGIGHKSVVALQEIGVLETFQEGLSGKLQSVGRGHLQAVDQRGAGESEAVVVVFWKMTVSAGKEAEIRYSW